VASDVNKTPRTVARTIAYIPCTECSVVALEGPPPMRESSRFRHVGNFFRLLHNHDSRLIKISNLPSLLSRDFRCAVYACDMQSNAFFHLSEVGGLGLVSDKYPIICFLRRPP
jgi:hypothetical protein